MKPIDSPSAASSDSTPRVPDYKPRDRLDPKWRPGTSVRAKLASRSGEVIDDPWMYSQRSLREHRSMLPPRRIMLWLLLAMGVAAAGLVGVSMSGPDDGQRWSAPAAQAGMHENANPAALRQHSEPAEIQSDGPEASQSIAESAAHRTATPSATVAAAGARIGSMAASTATPEPDAPTGMRAAQALAVIPVLAEREPATVVAQGQASVVPSPALSGGDDVRRAQLPRKEAGSVECSQAQQAMQLCGIADSSRR